MLRYAIFAILGSLLLTGSMGYAEEMTLDQVLEQMAAQPTMRAHTLGFEQHVSIRALVFRWSFVNKVEKVGDRIRVDAGDGAPGFVPQEATTDLLDLQQAFDDFVLNLVGREESADGIWHYVIDGTRKDDSPQGVRSGRMWIDPEAWVVAKAELRYPWGTLTVDQSYRQEEGRLVLDRQHAVARPLGVRLDIEYRAYWFDQP